MDVVETLLGLSRAERRGRLHLYGEPFGGVREIVGAEARRTLATLRFDDGAVIEIDAPMGLLAGPDILVVPQARFVVLREGGEMTTRFDRIGDEVRREPPGGEPPSAEAGALALLRR